MNAIFVVGVFVVSLGTIMGVYWLLVLRPEGQQEDVLRRRLVGEKRRVPRAVIVKAPDNLSGFAPLNTFLASQERIVLPLRRMIVRSGRDTSVGTVLLACILAGLVAFAATTYFTKAWYGLIAGAIGIWIPVLLLKRSATKRAMVFEEQFPEAVDLLSRALRAGHALTSGLQMVGDEVPDPVGAEFRTLFEQQNYGMSLPDALKELAARVPVLDARFFVTALLTQRETGGNLSEVLDKLASVTRERFKVKRQVRAISAHGRITGFALAFLPLSVAAILSITSPTFIRILIDDPLGVDMIIGALILQVVGVLIIRKIINVEY
jgi:tight adherence protein B